ncbi:MAG: B12-binding domain-containing radical SAM protein [Actinobacteria bacterium]|nr:B12-binding domain-containing radical SAM protein [Actinomycetota bacterium]
MKILMVYPDYENTFWSFKAVLKLLGKKAAFPPLGLMTVGSMLPATWEKKLVDMNCENLKDEHIKWADYVMISAMIVQKDSTRKVISRAKDLGRPVIAGGPLFTTGHEEFPEIDHMVLGEVEEIIVDIINDMEKGTLKKIYSVEKFPDIEKSPVPSWDLVRLRNYNSMCIQFSRGCPFNCEFCDVVQLNGRIPRLKSTRQLISELESLKRTGWRAGVFFVDDNLIGNKVRFKNEHLPAIIKWQKKNHYPFTFNTQVSINLADDSELIKMMVEAGFTSVFIGIETPDADSLTECGKVQNKDRDLLQCVKDIQNLGLEVQGGFIMGFDSDKVSIFQRQIDFIQKSGIVTAMVGLLTALPKTRLYQRLSESRRLVKVASGNNTGVASLNFVPKMDTTVLINGYRRVLSTIYSPKSYYERIRVFLQEYKPKKVKKLKISMYYIRATISSFWLLGFRQKGRRYFWRLILWSLLHKPGLLPYAVGFSLTGLHFRNLE